ncbi:MAG: hypothetical protein WA191_02030 [Telluria sp.]|nr:hypothetical protein [Oxalobacteraceae bacterium]
MSMLHTNTVALMFLKTNNDYASLPCFSATVKPAPMAALFGFDATWLIRALSSQPRELASEFDLTAGHWRRPREEKTGNGYTKTYYDALWRDIYTERIWAGMPEHLVVYNQAGNRIVASGVVLGDTCQGDETALRMG